MVTININEDELLTLGEASRRFPTIDGKRPSTNSMWRWCRRGVRGIRLGYVRVGRKICTTPAAINAFCNELAEADELPAATPPVTSSPRTDHQRAKAIADAERELSNAGI